MAWRSSSFRTTVICAQEEFYRFWHQIDGLVQVCSNSIADALQILQSCTKPWKCGIIVQMWIICLHVTWPNILRYGLYRWVSANALQLRLSRSNPSIYSMTITKVELCILTRHPISHPLASYRASTMGTFIESRLRDTGTSLYMCHWLQWHPVNSMVVFNSGTGFALVRNQSINLTNAGVWSIWHLVTSAGKIYIKIHNSISWKYFWRVLLLMSYISSSPNMSTHKTVSSQIMSICQ